MSETTSQSAAGKHLATVSHLGRFWDVYLEIDDGPKSVSSCRGYLTFSPADGNEPGALRTADILIERSLDDVVRKAHEFQDHHLVALLRSTLPDE